MTTTAPFPVTMTELRGEPGHSGLWPNYASSAHLTSRLGGSMDSSFGNPASSTSSTARPRSDHANVEQPTYQYGHYATGEADQYDRPSQPSMASQGYPSLKRTFSQTEAPAYQEIVQDLRDDGSRLSVNNDQKLLAFRKSQDKSTIVDQHGRMQQLEMSAQLHGMFFLSEMPSNTTDGNVLQPELTCYRRNLFQISGSLITPRGQLSVVTEAGETVPVSSMEVTISAIESVDGNSVRLIVIPWKTPPPNSQEVNQSPDQEPPPLPLIPFQEDGIEADGDYAVYPIGWRRLQFRIATANNGRRKELQQHFVLHLKVMGTLANNNKVVLAESTTAPVVVRGRSPRNFQARKEIPLLGSSAGSRGQALVESGLGVVAGVAGKHQESKARALDIPPVPRSAFTFSPPKSGPNQLNPARSSTYPSWNSSSNPSLSQLPPSSAGGYPHTTMAGDPYHKAPGFSADAQELPLPQSIPSSVPLPVDPSHPPVRSQYPYMHPSTSSAQLPGSSAALGSGIDSGMSVPRYVDSGRPMKSPRTSGHTSVHGGTSVASSDASPEYRYGGYTPASNAPSSVPTSAYGVDSSQTSAAQRDYYPNPGSWTTPAGEARPNVPYPGGDARSYPYSADQFKGQAAGPAPTKPEGPQGGSSAELSGPGRSSFEPMNNYSWSGN